MGPFDRFTDRAKRVIALSHSEAVRFNHDYIGVEHLLLGLTCEGSNPAAWALDALGIKLGQLRASVESATPRGTVTTPPNEIVLANVLTPRAKRVIELAADEARELGDDHVGPEHLLLAIVREGNSVATGVLASLGVSLENLRQQTISEIDLGPPHRRDTPPPR
jgi:ATP-dependent Clp protease ATP-binding subunit ClpC